MLKSAICIGFLFAVSGWGQSSSITTTQVTVVIQPEAMLAWQGDSAIIVKARLAPGTQARVWAGESCGAPTPTSQVISTSGTAVIQLAAMDGEGKPMVCLSTSDGRVSMNLAALHN